MKSMEWTKKRIIPGFGLSVTLTVTMLLILILIPLVSVLASAFKMPTDKFISVISQSSVQNAFLTSITSSMIAAFINAIFGTIIAWVLVRYDFPCKRIIDGLIELPFAMPTAIAGITLAKLYSTTGVFGSLLSRVGIRVSYTKLGILVALVFVGMPFTVRSVMPVLVKLNSVYEEAAYTLGAGTVQTVIKIIIPELFPAILTGFALSFARGIGEYGSVLYISGNSAKEHTQVVSYLIMQKLNYMDYESATVIALLLLLISFMVLLFINIIQSWQGKRTYNSGETVNINRGLSIQDNRLVRMILIIICILYTFFVLVVPLISVIYRSLTKGLVFYFQSINTSYVKSALLVTIIATVITVIVNAFFGLVSSWLLTRFDFKGKQVLASLIDLPFSVSPVIAGLSFIMMFGRLGWAYPVISWINDTLGTNIQIVFSLPGVVLATIFVTFPFVSREIIPVLNTKGRDEETAAAAMGAGGGEIFRRITFPHVKWAFLYGVILCMARAMGEFGAVNALSKVRGKTFTLPLEIDALYMSGNADSITSAFCVSSILVMVAVGILVVRSLVEYREKKTCM